LVTAGATARAMMGVASGRITLVAMGKENITRTDEDEVCALHLRNLLQGRRGNAKAVRQLILPGGERRAFVILCAPTCIQMILR
jgi:2-phosphosulfolactate phosphatase